MALMPHPEVDGGGVGSGSHHHLCHDSGDIDFFNSLLLLKRLLLLNLLRIAFHLLLLLKVI